VAGHSDVPQFDGSSNAERAAAIVAMRVTGTDQLLGQLLGANISRGLKR
jgi:hypothetical protein